jgi:fermentation-respiration switch protein FrsA (DUF1100 family)
VLVAALVIASAAVAGARPLDAIVCGVVAALPWLVRVVPAPRRRRLWRLEAPVLVVGATVVATVLAASAAATLSAPMPWGDALRFAAYLLAWIVVLRALHCAAQRGARSVCPLRWARAPLAGVVTVALGFPLVWIALQTHRIRVPQSPLADRLAPVVVGGERARDVGFRTADGLWLAGTWLPAADPDPAAPVVVVCHGLGANRASCFGYAEIASRAGCHALAFDFRAHGASAGFVSTFGHDEVLDVIAAVAWVRAQPATARSPLALVGVSMGAATALRAAAIVCADGVLAESAFADLATMVEHQAAPLGPLAPAAARAVGIASAWLLGVDVAEVTPRASLAALPAAVVVRLLHAADDELVPVAEGRALAASRPGLVLQTVPGARHGGCLGADFGRVDATCREWLTAVRARHERVRDAAPAGAERGQPSSGSR